MGPRLRETRDQENALCFDRCGQRPQAAFVRCQGRVFGHGRCLHENARRTVGGEAASQGIVRRDEPYLGDSAVRDFRIVEGVE